MTAEQFIQSYGYLALAIGAILEGETIVILSGFLAHRDYFSLPIVVLIAAAASFAGDQFYFWMGRLHGQKLLARRPGWQARVSRVHEALDRHPTLFMAGFRFMTGMRSLGAVVIGMTPVRAPRFMAFNALGAAVWASVMSTAGYLFGEALENFIADIRRHEFLIVSILLGTAALIWVMRRIRAQRPKAGAVTLLALLFLTAFSAAAADTVAGVPLKLSREKKPGERYFGKFHVTDKMQMEFFANDKALPPTANYLDVELESTEEILAVSARGKPTEIKVVVSKVTAKRTENGAAEIFPSRGIPLKIRLWPDWAAEREDKMLLSELELAVLRMVFEKVQEPEQTDDDVFGTTALVRKGDTWEPNHLLLAQSFKKSGFEADPGKIRGSVKVLDRTAIEGVDSLILEANLEMEGTLQLKNFGPVKNWTRVRFTSNIPVDPALTGGNGELRMESSMQGEKLGNNNVKLRVQGKGERVKKASEIRRLDQTVSK